MYFRIALLLTVTVTLVVFAVRAAENPEANMSLSSASAATCPGDFDGSGKVNLADFLAFAGAFGTRSGDANFNALMDVDGNGAIDLSDFLAFAGVFGTTCENRPDGSVSQDRAALVALYNATDGLNWVNNDNWLTDAPLGEWYGVETDASGRVVALNLASKWDQNTHQWVPQGLSGQIPVELAGLSQLQVLDLGVNDLSGQIPVELAGLSQLQVLDLRGNDLSGRFPPQLGDLANLRKLDLGGNDFRRSPFPVELGNLTNLESLDLRNTYFSGRIPPELGNLTNLKYLDLSQIFFHGTIPPELGKLVNLESLDLSFSYISGPIPPELGNLTKLKYLNLDINDLSGPIPASFLQLGLHRLWLYDNERLCVPGTSAFAAWLEGIGDALVLEGKYDDNLPVVRCNSADLDALKALYDSTGGAGWSRSDGWLSDGDLSEWHGVSTDYTGRVTELDLAGNELNGRLPTNLGDLGSMTVLRIGDNSLSGRLPPTLPRIPLREFLYADTEMCEPAAAPFRVWLDSIEKHEGTGASCESLSNRDLLKALFKGTDGPNWVNSGNWLTGAPLGDWYGVEVDGKGRVVGVRLPDNNLSGPVPPEIGNLANLVELDLSGNNLRGPLVPELGNLASLRHLDVSGNAFTGPLPPEVGNLTNLTYLDIRSNGFWGPLVPELSSLTSLRQLLLGYNKWHGAVPPELGNLVRLERLDNEGCAYMVGPLPPEFGNLANIKYLHLGGLTGPVPPEFGNLANLVELVLLGISGPIPPELGNLGDLQRLILRSPALGPIPQELGNLANLVELDLLGISGPIPPELGNLAKLRLLSLTGSRLTGPIPPELGKLSALSRMDLGGNRLSGPLPPPLGNLSSLQFLSLNSNDLSGPLPPELGNLSVLHHLDLAGNPELTGPLPSELTALARLESFFARNTGLCAPSDPAIQTWLAGVPQNQVSVCGAEVIAAYLTQAVQSREFPVPLVAGEKALLRVFPTARKGTSAGIPPVRARFYRNDRETHVVNIPGQSTPIPTEVDESDLAKSANTEIPGRVVQPGLEMVIEVDPEGALDAALGVTTRIPAEGRLAVTVREMPLFDLTMIPFVWEATRDSSILDLVVAMEADPKNHDMLTSVHTLLPVEELKVTAHEPVISASNNVFTLLRETAAIRAMEGGHGHYMGLMSGNVVGGAGGVAYISGWSSASVAEGIKIAHELGHNLSLSHAPCGGATGMDPQYPYPDGSIGAWGYDFADGRLVHPSTADLMSYCGPRWISDYHFTNALRYRLHTAASGELSSLVAAPVEALLLWGGLESDGAPYLEPAFVVEAHGTLPDSTGSYDVIGLNAVGGELFSLTFGMPVTADAEGEETSFVFTLPVQPEWAGSLASITLNGPGGSATLDETTDRPMAILRDPVTRQVRGFLSDLPAGTSAQAAAKRALVAEPGLEVLFSRGIPEFGN